MPTSFKPSHRLRSFKFAFNGIIYLLKTQPNAWIHLIATIAVVIMGFIFNISAAEWCWIVWAIFSVWITEAINTSVEFLGDAITQETNWHIGHAKDIAAAAVLFAAIAASIIAAVIFIPKIC